MARAPEVEAEEVPPEPDRAEGAPHPRLTLRLHGQEAAEAAFLAAWRAGRLPHAWLLTGPRGVGKATLAWRMARAVLAAEPGIFGETPPESLDMDPAHPVFRRTASLGEGRLRLLRRGWDDKTGRLRTQIAAEDARALRELFERSAPDGGWRVAIVDAVDEMTPQAANSLLKLIEEPPPRSLFLLVGHAPSRLLPTIRSRCRRLTLAPLGPQALGAALADALAAEGGGPPPTGSEAAALAELSEGSAGEALRLLALGGPGLYAELVGAMGRAPGMDRALWHDWAAAASGRDGEARFDAARTLAAALLRRLARAAATGAPPSPEAAAGEAALAARLAARPAQARVWAEAAQTIPARAARARGVNLDPDRIILDIFASLDAAARRAASL